MEAASRSSQAREPPGHFGASGQRRLMVFSRFLLASAMIVFLARCTAGADPPATNTGSTVVGGDPGGAGDASADSRLEKVRAVRASDAFTPSFSLGPGDVLEISEPDVAELRVR